MKTKKINEISSIQNLILKMESQEAKADIRRLYEQSEQKYDELNLLKHHLELNLKNRAGEGTVGGGRKITIWDSNGMSLLNRLKQAKTPGQIERILKAGHGAENASPRTRRKWKAAAIKRVIELETGSTYCQRRGGKS
jgi:hypothetical protein